MSGNEEKERNNLLPKCGFCGEQDWYKGERVIHYYELRDYNGTIVISSDNDYEYTSDYTEWQCSECGRRATAVQHAKLENLFNKGTWV